MPWHACKEEPKNTENTVGKPTCRAERVKKLRRAIIKAKKKVLSAITKAKH